MIEGDANGRGFQYPIPTYSITRDFDWSDTENNRLLFEMTAKYGTPYFSNYINSDMEPSDVRSMCCRLRLDLRELRKKSGGFFGSGESTGSVGVVTINLPRIAYLAQDEADFYARLNQIMDLSARSLKTKRTVITSLLNAGLYPYTKRYLGSFENHFSTIGLIGMNEVGLNAKWLRKDLTHAETQAFAKDVLNHMRERLSDYQEKYGDLYNLEATPAESTTYRLAKHDVAQYPNIITAAKPGDTPYYTNSSHLPVGYTADIFEALAIQDELQTLYTSGTVFHAFLGEKLPDWKAAANLVHKIAENFKLPYYTISPTYSICPEHGVSALTVPRKGSCQELFEWELSARLREYEVDLIVLAGFLSILSPNFVAQWPGRIVNVHPSLIPAFCGKGFYGLKVHEAALAQGVKITGATVHLVNEIPDGGRILLQKAVRILPGDTPESLQQRVMEQAEWVLLPRATELLCRELTRKGTPK